MRLNEFLKENRKLAATYFDSRHLDGSRQMIKLVQELENSGLVLGKDFFFKSGQDGWILNHKLDYEQARILGKYSVEEIGIDEGYENVNEKAPPGMEDWIKSNKARFKKQYGKDKGEEILYATAWKRHNNKKKKKSESIGETTSAGSVAVAAAPMGSIVSRMGHGPKKPKKKKTNENLENEWDYEFDNDVLVLLHNNNEVCQIPIDEWDGIIHHYLKTQRKRGGE